MKTLRNLVLSFFVLFGLSFAQAADELLIDQGHSEVGFSIKHLMISNVKGKFTDYDAEILFDQKEKKFTKLDAKIVASSIDTGIEKRDEHLRSADFFEVEKFPEIRFVMNSYEVNEDGGVMKGDITIHGVTKPLKLEVTYNGSIKDMNGNTKIGFTFEGKLDRKDFGLTWNKALEMGGVVVGDQVKLEIELQTLVM